MSREGRECQISVLRFNADSNPVTLAGIIEFLCLSDTVALLSVLSRRKAIEAAPAAGEREEQSYIPFSRSLVDRVIKMAWDARDDAASEIPISNLKCVSYGGSEGRVSATLLRGVHDLVSQLPLVIGKYYKGEGLYAFKGEEYGSAVVPIAGDLFLLLDLSATDGVVIFDSVVVSFTLQVAAAKCNGGAKFEENRTQWGCSQERTSLLCCTHCLGLLGNCYGSSYGGCANKCPTKDCECERVCKDCFEFDHSKDPKTEMRYAATGCKGCNFDCNECEETTAASFKVGCADANCIHHERFEDDMCIDCAEDGADFGQCRDCRQVFCNDCSGTCAVCQDRYCFDEREICRCSMCHTRRCISHLKMSQCDKCSKVRCFTCDMSYCYGCDGVSYCFDCAKTEMVGEYMCYDEWSARCKSCAAKGK